MDTRITPRRQAEILALAREVGRVSVEDLAARFAVTPQTIRRDLNEMCESRALTRVHGGAIVAGGWRTWPMMRASWWPSRISG